VESAKRKQNSKKKAYDYSGKGSIQKVETSKETISPPVNREKVLFKDTESHQSCSTTKNQNTSLISHYQKLVSENGMDYNSKDMNTPHRPISIVNKDCLQNAEQRK
jgi:hypothetical protein